MSEVNKGYLDISHKCKDVIRTVLTNVGAYRTYMYYNRTKYIYITHTATWSVWYSHERGVCRCYTNSVVMFCRPCIFMH